MSDWKKLEEKILFLDQNTRFEELKKVLEFYGYTMRSPHSGSSHFTFRKAGCQPITVPKHKPIKKIYLKMVREVIEREAEKDENA